jgi:hypothetical protein
VEAKRIFISILLLCTYSLSFAQGLLPHSHDWQEGIGFDDHHHYVHQSSEESSTPHPGHLANENICDQSIYDLILCFLTDLDSPDTDARAEVNTSVFSGLNITQQVQMAAVILSFIPLPELKEEIFVHQSEPLVQRLLTRYIPQRGPPGIS